MALKLVTAPITEPITVAEMKDYLRVDGTEFDELISSLIQSARQHCELFQNRAYMTQTWNLVLDEFPKVPFKIPKPPLQSIVSIKYTDRDGVENTWDASNYIVDTASEPGRVTLAHGKSFPFVELQPVNGVTIQFVAGYAEAQVPENVKNALKIFVAHRFENPESDDLPQVVHHLLWPDRMMPV